jgi:hypothetical protein
MEVRKAVCGTGLAAMVRKEFQTKGTPFYLGFSYLTVTLNFWTLILNLSAVGLIALLCLLSYSYKAKGQKLPIFPFLSPLFYDIN